MSKRKISWDKQALNYFREAIRYIREDSPQNADKVKKEVLEKINELSSRPEIHKENEIIIARVRNTSQEPLDY
jgi:plasmid stabilization system protein ParE